jgi:hypothetical protein
MGLTVEKVLTDGKGCVDNHYMNNTTYRIGNTVSLPDGSTGPIVRIEEGVEYGEKALYVTISTSYGEQTRWVR